MKTRLLVMVVILLLTPYLVVAQGKGKHKKNKAHKSYRTKTLGPPPWAPAHGYRAKQHVYFPDYYTYYDPTRGYVYWNEGSWVVSRTVPSFLLNVDLGKARIQVLGDIGLSVHPELNYLEYQRLYPARGVEINVQIPW